MGCSSMAGQRRAARVREAPALLEGDVVVLRPRGAHVVEPVAVVQVGGALDEVAGLALLGRGQRPRLALVGPVLGLEAVGPPEPGHGRVPLALAPQVLAQLEAGCGLGVLGGTGPGAGPDLLRRQGPRAGPAPLAPV